MLVFFVVCVISGFAVILSRRRGLVALRLLSFWCLATVGVLWLFLVVPWVGLQCDISNWYFMIMLAYFFIDIIKFVKHSEVIVKYNIGLKNSFSIGHIGVFYGDLVYKFKRIVWNPNYSDQFKNSTKRYKKKVGYNRDIMRQSACLVVHPITAYSYSFLFNCTTMGQASDSMMLLAGLEPMYEEKWKYHPPPPLGVRVLWLFLAMSWVGLRCVIVFFLDHIHLLFYKEIVSNNKATNSVLSNRNNNQSYYLL